MPSRRPPLCPPMKPAPKTKDPNVPRYPGQGKLDKQVAALDVDDLATTRQLPTHTITRVVRSAQAIA